MSTENKSDVSSTEPEDFPEYYHTTMCGCSFVYDNMDFYSDCSKFTKLYEEKTGKKSDGKINRKFITQMVMDELDELNRAKDVAEEVDALLDAVYYIFQHLSTTGLDIRPIWQQIHNANMTKFEKGHKRQDGKWMKPVDFVAPDNKIREIIADQQKGISPQLQLWLEDETIKIPLVFRWDMVIPLQKDGAFSIPFCQVCFNQLKAYINTRKQANVYPYVIIEDKWIAQCFSKTPVDDEQWLDEVMEAIARDEQSKLFD